MQSKRDRYVTSLRLLSHVFRIIIDYIVVRHLPTWDLWLYKEKLHFHPLGILLDLRNSWVQWFSTAEIQIVEQTEQLLKSMFCKSIEPLTTRHGCQHCTPGDFKSCLKHIASQTIHNDSGSLLVKIVVLLENAGCACEIKKNPLKLRVSVYYTVLLT